MLNNLRSSKTLLLVATMIVAGALVSFGTQWMLATSYSKESFGLFAGAWSLFQISLQFTSFGTHHFLLSRSATRSHRFWITNCAVLFTANSLILALVVTIAGGVFGYLDPFQMLFWFWVVFSLPPVLVYVFFQIDSNQEAIAHWPFGQLLVRFLLVSLSIWLGLSIDIQPALFALAAGVFSLWSLVLLKRGLRRHLSTGKHIRLRRIRLLVEKSFAYFTHEFFEKADLRIALPISVILLGGEATADLAITISILLAILLIPQGLFQRYFLSRMHVWAKTDYQRLRSFIYQSVAALVCLSVVAAVMLSPVLEWVVVFLFGNDFLPAVDMLQCALFVPPFLLSTNALCNLFLAADRIVVLQKIQIIWFALFLVTLYFFASNFGAIGVCYSLVVGRFLYLVLMLFNLSQHSGVFHSPKAA